MELGDTLPTTVAGSLKNNRLRKELSIDIPIVMENDLMCHESIIDVSLAMEPAWWPECCIYRAPKKLREFFPCLEATQTFLHVPQFLVDDKTESLFRNLMALEQCHYPSEAYICNYICLLDYLINTREDVELLVDKKIIINMLGSNEVIATMVNKLGLEIVETGSCYFDLAQELNKHYDQCCNHNMGNLRSTYFPNLWRGTATIIGLIVLGFTLWDFIRHYVRH
uniref:Uncharacterized protein n=1 Tax=Quercus lobata TaxID=97700 RepID=A0A7N2LF89_QUELO